MKEAFLTLGYEEKLSAVTVFVCLLDRTQSSCLPVCEKGRKK